MDEVVDADQVVLLHGVLDDRVVVERRAPMLHLGEAALEHQVVHGLHARVAPGDVRLDHAQHGQRRLVQLDEHAVVDLQQTQQLQHLARLRRDLVHTADADGERDARLGRHVEVAGLLRLALVAAIGE